MQQRRTTQLAGAAVVVLLVALLAALATWVHLRSGNGSSGNPLAIGVVFAAVLTAGAVGLLILSGRPQRAARPLPTPPAGSTAGAEPVSTVVPGSGASPAVTDPAVADGSSGAAGGATREPPVLRPRTALDPLGRRYGRHARQESPAGAGADPARDGPMVSELAHPLPEDLAVTLQDQLFTHRGVAADRD